MFLRRPTSRERNDRQLRALTAEAAAPAAAAPQPAMPAPAVVLPELQLTAEERAIAASQGVPERVALAALRMWLAEGRDRAELFAPGAVMY